jgi:hypothetical protein
MTNPQFLLQCTQSNCVDILLAQSGSKVTFLKNSEGRVWRSGNKEKAIYPKIG